MGALTLTGDWRRPPFEPGIPGVIHVQDCYCDRCPFGKTLATCKRECATNIGDTMALEGPRSVAAVFLEPVPGANGVLVPPPEYWPLVRAACDAEGALLVADEVLTGFGRTGKPFGFQHWDVVAGHHHGREGARVGLRDDRRGDRARAGREALRRRRARVRPHVLRASDRVRGGARDDEAVRGRADVRERGAPRARAARASSTRSRRACWRSRSCARSACSARSSSRRRRRSWATLGKELAQRKLSLHVDGKRGTAIFAPPLCITEEELVTGLRSFGDAAVAAFGGAP